MGIGNALAAAVNGYVGGRNVRHGWEDRKIDHARKKRLDELRENAEVRTQQAHEMGLETSGLLNTSRQQAIRQVDQDWGDNQSMRGVLNDADAAAAAGMQPAAAPDLSASLDPAVVSTSGGNGLLAAEIADAQRAATAPALGAIRGDASPSQPVTPIVARRSQSNAAPDAPAAAAGEPSMGAIRPAQRPARDAQGSTDLRPTIRAATEPVLGAIRQDQTLQRAPKWICFVCGQMEPMWPTVSPRPQTKSASCWNWPKRESWACPKGERLNSMRSTRTQPWICHMNTAKTAIS